MEAPKRTRSCRFDCQQAEKTVSKGERQICLPLSREDYQQHWSDPKWLREYIDRLIGCHPECFPPGIKHGYQLAGKLPESRKLPEIQLRKLILKGDRKIYTLRPSFVLSYMMGELSKPVPETVAVGTPKVEIGLELLSHNVPVDLVVKACGGTAMFWERLLQRIGRNSLVGTTVSAPKQIPQDLTADEHHLKWCKEKGFVALTVGQDCILGLALTAGADDAHLEKAYGQFEQEVRQVAPEYAPRTVNTDGWAATQNAFQHLFQGIAIILCFLHGFLKVRDRCRKNKEIHDQVWHVYRAETAEEFRQRMEQLKQTSDRSASKATVKEMIDKLHKRTDEYVLSYQHPGCHRTSNAVDRPMNALHRQAYAGRGLHGHQWSSERRLRGWALLYNFRPFAHRSNLNRNVTCRAQRLNPKCYSTNWVENLMISASGNGLWKHT